MSVFRWLFVSLSIRMCVFMFDTKFIQHLLTCIYNFTMKSTSKSKLFYAWPTQADWLASTSSNRKKISNKKMEGKHFRKSSYKTTFTMKMLWNDNTLTVCTIAYIYLLELYLFCGIQNTKSSTIFAFPSFIVAVVIVNITGKNIEKVSPPSAHSIHLLCLKL